MKTAILGGNGLLGSDLVKYLSAEYEVTSITKKNYNENKEKKFDFFINANGNSKRYWALQNVYEDFEASTASVYKTIFDFKFKKYIYISSADVYPNPSGPLKTSESTKIDINKQNTYGFHKFLSEQIVKKHSDDWLILRSSAILGTNLKKGPFFDVLNDQQLFITLDTRLQFITATTIAKIVEVLLKKSIKRKIFNIGGLGTFDFSNIGDYFHQKINFSSKAKKQTYEMNVQKLKKIYPELRTSTEYVEEFLAKQVNRNIGIQ